MKIEKTIHGWQIEPSTDKEENALEFFLHALLETYCSSISKTDVDPANHLFPLDHSPSTVSSA